MLDRTIATTVQFETHMDDLFVCCVHNSTFKLGMKKTSYMFSLSLRLWLMSGVSCSAPLWCAASGRHHFHWIWFICGTLSPHPNWLCWFAACGLRPQVRYHSWIMSNAGGVNGWPCGQCVRTTIPPQGDDDHSDETDEHEFAFRSGICIRGYSPRIHYLYSVAWQFAHWIIHSNRPPPFSFIKWIRSSAAAYTCLLCIPLEPERVFSCGKHRSQSNHRIPNVTPRATRNVLIEITETKNFKMLTWWICW